MTDACSPNSPLEDLQDARDEELKTKEPPRTVEWDHDTGRGVIQTGRVGADFNPNDNDAVLRHHGLDPAKWRIVGHVGFTEWDVPFRTDTGLRQFHKAQSHRFQIEQRGWAVDLPALYAEFDKTKVTAPRKPKTGQSSVVVCWADIQTGKVDHLGGVQELVERLEEKRQALDRYLHQAPCDSIVIADCGDIIEGFGNFPAQHRTNGLSLMDQVDMATTEFWRTIRLCSSYAPVDVLSIPSNHCVDADTEILTPKGWIRAEDFDGTGEVAAYNPESDSMEWQPVLHWTSKPHTGRMLHVNSRTVDHMVTADHDLYGRGKGTSRKKPMAKVRAQDAFSRSGWEFLQTAGSWEGKADFPAPQGFGVLSSDPLLAARFYGWYVSEGSTYIRDARNYAVVISQSKAVHPDNYDEIARVWREVGRSASLGPKTLTVGSKYLALFLREHFGCTSGEKRLPSWLKEAPPDVLAEFMRAYLLGDGYNRSTWSTVASKSKQLMDDLQEVCLKLGWRMVYDQNIKNFPFRRTEYVGQAYVGYINKRRRGAVIEWAHPGRRENGTWVEYDGIVYCPTVSSGLWFSRRNGKVVVTGNCAWRKEGKNLAGKTTDDWGLHINKNLEWHNQEIGLPVNFHRPADWDETLQFDVRGTRLGLAHGHQVNNPDQIKNWWAKMTHAGVLDCNLLVTGHFHFASLRPVGKDPATRRSRWHIQAPTLDNGSSWVRNKYGEDGDPALCVFQVTDDGFDVQSFALL
jgi:hypothetical protein